MKIKTRLYASAVISVSLICILAMILLHYSFETKCELKKENRADMLLRETTDLILISEEYLAYHYERKEKQWESKFDSLTELIKKEKPHVINQMFKHLRLLEVSFSRLKAEYQKIERNVKNMSKEEYDTFLILEERLSGQMRLSSNGILSIVFKISENTHHKVDLLQKQSTLVILAFTIFLIIIITITLSITIRKITIPLAELIAMTHIIRQGNLGYDMKKNAAHINEDDEIGELFLAFDMMTRQLIQSIENLEREVEERKLAEKELSLFKAIIESSQEAIAISNSEGSLIYINPAHEKLFGRPFEEARQCNYRDYYPPESVEVLNQEVAPALAREESWEGEMDVLDANGRRFPLWERADSLFDETGKMLYGFGFMHDITERRQTEETLRRLHHLLNNIINSMPSILVGVNSDEKIMQWNQEAEKVTGISADKACGQTLTDVFPQLIKEMNKIREAIRNRQPWKQEKIVWGKDEGIRYCDLTVYPLISNDVEGAVIRVDDVTKRVRIEDMMIQTEKMMSVGGLAAGMAHEINNPLAGIIQSVQNILRRVSPDLPANKKAALECGTDPNTIRAYMEKRGILNFLEGIRESGERAAKIVENMLNFSRRSESSMAPANLAVLLDRTVELASHDYDLKKKYDFRQIEIIREYESDMPEVPCTATEIEQVILNLLRNAAQAMENWKLEIGNSESEVRSQKSEVRIATSHEPTANNHELKANNQQLTANSQQLTANSQQLTANSRITLRLKKEGNTARIEVEDNGAGMKENIRKRVFEPFFTTKDVGIGTGLGLSVSYFIITNNHNGTMAVESEPGKGSCFIIHLPLKRENYVQKQIR